VANRNHNPLAARSSADCEATVVPARPYTFAFFFEAHICCDGLTKPRRG
jgi:hypothetical protein